MARVKETVENAIVAFVNSAVSDYTSITVFWDKQDATGNVNVPTLPDYPFVTLNISSGPSKIGRSANIKYKSGDTFTYLFRRQITVTVNVYAQSDHLAIIDAIIKAVVLPDKNVILRDAGVAVQDHSDPVDISALLESHHEFRSTVDLFIAYHDEVDSTPGRIEKARVNKTNDPTFEAEIDGS